MAYATLMHSGQTVHAGPSPKRQRQEKHSLQCANVYGAPSGLSASLALAARITGTHYHERYQPTVRRLHRPAWAVIMVLMMVLVMPCWAQGPYPRRTPVVEAVERTQNAIVNINTTTVVTVRRSPFGFDDEIFRYFGDMFPPQRREAHSLGSGVVIHPSGYLVTNAHVVAQADRLDVTFVDDRTFTAAEDSIYPVPEYDLAVVKIDVDEPLPYVGLGSSDDLMIGETVIAIGNPLGYSHSVTTGVVSAIGRTLEFRGGESFRNLIQTDAAINPGNSGGPLLNINGELIGINTAIRGDAQNIGFAIPVDQLNRLLPDILDIEYTRGADFGARLEPTDNNRVRVYTVREDSVAGRAGLKPGDVITSVNGRTVAMPMDVYVALLETPFDDTVRFGVDRHTGTSETVSFKMTRRPPPDGKELALRRLGLGLAEERGVAALRVTGVRQGTEAHEVGIKAGDYVYMLGSRRTRTLEQIGQVLDTLRPGSEVYVGILRPHGRTVVRTGTFLTVK